MKKVPGELQLSFPEWDLGKCAYNEKGEELIDPRPLEMPAGFERPATLADIISQVLRPEVQEELRDRAGVETFEDANDFDVDDDPPIEAPWQDPDVGPGMTRELEMRAGQVAEPDFLKAKEIYEKAKSFLQKYDRNGNLLPAKEKA